jgi:hypothetical protein
MRNSTVRSLVDVLRRLAFLPAALLLTWPAFYNRYPLLFPDSLSYIESGPRVARALFLHHFSHYYGVRSFVYALGIAPFHPSAVLWPVIALQSVITAYVLWLVVRSFTIPADGCPTFTPCLSALRWEAKSPVTTYYAIMLPLALLTGLSWTTSIVMPDILGALLYLAVYLLVFAPESLSRPQRALLILIAWWSAAAHITHIMLALGLLIFLLAALFLVRAVTRSRLRGLAISAAILVAAVLSHMAVHQALYGKPTLNGKRPAYLTARLIADGTGRLYLQQHCPQANFAMCGFVQNLPANTDEFLWNANGIWQTASPETQSLILRQESSFAMAVVRAYPRQQLAISLHAFRKQLTSFDISNDANPWLGQKLEVGLPGQRPFYERSRQAQNTLPDELLSTIQNWTIAAALLVLCVLAPFLWKRRTARLMGLAATIFAILLGNAFVTAVLAEVDDRYQDRVIWLLPLLAALATLELFHQRRTRHAYAIPAPVG